MEQGGLRTGPKLRSDTGIAVINTRTASFFENKIADLDKFLHCFHLISNGLAHNIRKLKIGHFDLMMMSDQG